MYIFPKRGSEYYKITNSTHCHFTVLGVAMACQKLVYRAGFGITQCGDKACNGGHCMCGFVSVDGIGIVPCSQIDCDLIHCPKIIEEVWGSNRKFCGLPDCQHLERICLLKMRKQMNLEGLHGLADELSKTLHLPECLTLIITDYKG